MQNSGLTQIIQHNRIEKIQVNFLWHTEKGEKKFHLVNKCQICQPFEDGRLGIRTLKEMNWALLAKWLWRYGQEPNALWRKLITAKYSDHGRGRADRCRAMERDFQRICGVLKMVLF